MNDKEYYCEHCKKTYNEDEIEIDELEKEPLCPKCGEYLEEL